MAAEKRTAKEAEQMVAEVAGETCRLIGEEVHYEDLDVPSEVRRKIGRELIECEMDVSEILNEEPRADVLFPPGVRLVVH